MTLFFFFWLIKDLYLKTRKLQKGHDPTQRATDNSTQRAEENPT